MDFGLTEEQRMLQDSVAGFLSDNCSLDVVREAAESGTTHNRAIATGLAQLGVSGLLIEEEFGGVDLSLLDAALVCECLGANAAPVSFLGTAVMAPIALRLAGSDAQKDSYLPRIAAGELVVGIAVAEHIGRRDTDGIEASANSLHGSAMFVIEGDDADLLIVADHTGGLHLVDAADTRRTRLKTIDRTRNIGRIEFDHTRAEPMPGSKHNTAPLLAMIDAGRVMLGADTLGAAQKMLDDAITYAKERKQFNRVIGSFQAVKHMCAEMAAALEPCRSLVWYAAHALDAIPEEGHLMACHTKAHLAETGKLVARTATEVHGGMGMTDLLGLHYWFKRIGFNRQILGAPELVRAEAARAQGW